MDSESSTRCGQGSTNSAYSFNWAPGGNGLVASVAADEDPPSGGPTTPQQICLATGGSNDSTCTQPVAVDDGYGLSEPAVSPNGTELAVVAAPQGAEQIAAVQGAIWVFSYPAGVLLHELTTDTDDSTPTWSPDGSMIAFAHDNGIWVVPSNGSGVERMVAASGNEPTWGGPDIPANSGAGGGGSGGGGAGRASTTTLGTLTHSGTTISVAIRCSAGTGSCDDTVRLTTRETLRGSKVVAVAAHKTKHRVATLGSKAVSLPPAARRRCGSHSTAQARAC